MMQLIDQLNDPEIHFPGNFDTPKQANALLMCLCQEAAGVIKTQAAEIAKYKSLCHQMAYAMEIHGAPFLHHELRYNEALEAWRAMK